MQRRSFIVNRGLLERSPLHSLVLDAVEDALWAVHPENTIPRHLAASNGCVVVSGAGRFCPSGGLYVTGFGKASRSMAEAVLKVLGELIVEGVVVAPRGLGGRVGPIDVLEAEHPLPGPGSVRAARRILDFVSSLPRDSLLLVLVSGGGSSLLEMPEDGLELEDIVFVARELMGAGADIYEVNTVRKSLSAVKGGKLLRYTSSRLVVNLVMSDVPGDNPSFVASGPTVPGEPDPESTVEILKARGLWDSVPGRVKRFLLESMMRRRAPTSTRLQRPYTIIVAKNLDALRAVRKRLEASGYKTIVLTDTLRGEAREAGKVAASLVEGVSRGLLGFEAFTAGGETTVTVRGGGVGGRNQELCLSLALEASRLKIAGSYVAACVGTDGVDGNSPAAGALVDEDTVNDIRGEGVDPLKALEDNDSYTALSKAGRVILTGGYTGVNVNDVLVVVAGRGGR